MILKGEGTNIHYDLYVNFSEAVLELAKRLIPFLEKVKKNCNAGTIIW
jgi:molecular chaperone DnaJ